MFYDDFNSIKFVLYMLILFFIFGKEIIKLTLTNQKVYWAPELE